MSGNLMSYLKTGFATLSLDQGAQCLRTERGVNSLGAARGALRPFACLGYESINTSIADSALKLKQALAAAGHNKTLHVIAHSMGGPVTR